MTEAQWARTLEGDGGMGAGYLVPYIVTLIIDSV